MTNRVRKSFGVLFDSALELVIRALTPNMLKTVGLKLEEQVVHVERAIIIVAVVLLTTIHTNPVVILPLFR